MSRIPSKVMPHAGGNPKSNDHGGLDPEQGGEESGGSPTLSQRAGKLRDTVRDNPKTAIAAGVAITAGVAAAVAVPMARARRKTGDQKDEAKGSSGKGSKKKKD